MFIVYGISNISGITKIEDTDFITKNKNYLQIELTKINVEDFLNYEKLDCVEYMLPGDSNITFKMKFDEYYQTSGYTLEFSGSLSSLDTITKEEIIEGRMPENEYEIVIDKMVMQKAAQDNISAYMGIKTEKDLLQKKLYVDNMKEFKIVGFTDKQSPSIYANKNIFINLLNNTKTSGNGFGMYIPWQEEQEGEKVLDYSLYLDDITITKGRFPEADYEVIVNKSRSGEMKLNKTIKQTVNGKELKVVRIL